MSRFKQFRSAVCTALCLLGVSVIPVANAQSYSFIDLGTLGGNTNAYGHNSFAYGINNAGQVAGFSTFPNTTGGHATLWNGTTITDLGLLSGGSFSIGRSINNAGQVVGETQIAYDTSATLWNGTTSTDLGTLGGNISSARGINNAGQVAGYSYTTGNAVMHATRWDGTTITDLGTLGNTTGNAPSSVANGINNAGQVVGWSHGSVSIHATLWNGTTATDLGLGPLGLLSEAYAINDVGQVVGDRFTAAYNLNGTYRATLWDGTTSTDLGTLGGDGAYSFAYGINSAGQVVGWSHTTSDLTAFHATLWNGGNLFDLNSLVDSSAAGWTLTQAYGINDAGQIVGQANNSIGQTHAFLLTAAVPAIPEPETYALMLAGLGVLGFAARRRQRKSVQA